MIKQPSNTHIAEFNVAEAVDDLKSDRLRDFVSALDRVNSIAEQSTGFVWCLRDDSDDISSISAAENPRLLLNLSVWETPEDLAKFVWQTIHKHVYAKRAKWFEPPKQAHLVMWWVPKGHHPTLDEAHERLEILRANGATPEAFSWASLPAAAAWRAHRRA